MKKATALFLSCLFIFFTGCWDSKELDTLSIVIGVGIDAGSQPGNVILSLQVNYVGDVAEKSTGGGGGGEGKPYVMLTAEGSSYSEALEPLTKQISRFLYPPHNQIIIFGKEMAAQGISPQLDRIMRNWLSRMDQSLIVSNTTAEELLKINSGMEKTPGNRIRETIENRTQLSSELDVSLMRFCQKLLSKTTAPVIPMMEVLPSEEGESEMVASGLAVFKKDKMVGTFSEYETMGYLLLCSNVNGLNVDMKTNDNTDRAVLRVNKNSYKLEPKIDKTGKITLKARVKTFSILHELKGYRGKDLIEIFSILETESKQKIEEMIQNAFAKSQALKADIWGIGDMLYQKYPKEWKKIEDKWDEIYPTLKLELTVESKLLNSGEVDPSLMMVE